MKARLDEFGVEELNWPPQSPDLNPVKHLLDELEWRMGVFNVTMPKFFSIDTLSKILWKALAEEQMLL